MTKDTDQPLPPTPPPSSSLHPAQAISNIKNLVPLTFDLQKVQYNIWAELFQFAARAHNVMDHIDSTLPRDPNVSAAKWTQLDAIVLSWIYGTISEDILLTVIKSGSTAQEAWSRVKNLFHDNKSARAADLENQFNHCQLDQFPNATAYCQQLKSLADQLSDVDSAISDQRLVLQLINGLNRDYDTVGSIISNTSPLPTFLAARSMLLRDEARQQRNSESVALLSPAAALVAPSSHGTVPQNNNRNGNNNRNRGKGNRNNRNNRGKGINSPHTNHQHPRAQLAPQCYPQYGPYWPPTWTAPPCPYPTTAAPRQYNPAGLLGPPPRGPAAQSYMAPSVDYAYQSTELPNAFTTQTFQPPDQSWYMDTGASSHMATNPGKLRTLNNCSPISHVLVGNGSCIPVHGSGTTHLSHSHPNLTLSNVLVTPHIIKNLVYVRKFTTDNNVSVEFDPYGFCVKDLQTGGKVMRCDSVGELYPVTTSTSLPSVPVSLAAISPQL